MQFTKFVVLAALFGLATIDNNNVNAVMIKESMAIADFNGADEDEIMDKVFSKYSVEGKDHNGVKNGQKILMKSTAPKAAGVILEATHKLKGTQVPGYMKANFEKAWDRFDINQDGYIRAEETHTFMRSLMGKLNKFALAPGSLSDIGAAQGKAAADIKKSAEPKKKAAPKKAAKKAVKKDEEEEEATEDAPADDKKADKKAAKKEDKEETEEEAPAKDSAAQTEETPAAEEAPASE